MICKNCGATINDSAKFCEQCGVVIIRDAENNVQNQNFSFAIELDVKEAPVQYAECAVQTNDTQIPAEPKSVEAAQQEDKHTNSRKRFFKDKLSLGAMVMFCAAMLISLMKCGNCISSLVMYSNYYLVNRTVGLVLICVSSFLMIIHVAKEYKTDKKYYYLMSAMLLWVIGCHILEVEFIIGFNMYGIDVEFILIVVASLAVLHGSVKKYKRVSVPIVALSILTIFYIYMTFSFWGWYSDFLAANIGLLLITIRGLKKEEALTD